MLSMMETRVKDWIKSDLGIKTKCNSITIMLNNNQNRFEYRLGNGYCAGKKMFSGGGHVKAEHKERYSHQAH